MSNDTQTLVIAQCTDSKRDGKHEAKNLYDSPYFKAQRKYAEVFGDEWLILSAKHGLIAPTDRISDYDESFDSPVTAEDNHRRDSFFKKLGEQDSLGEAVEELPEWDVVLLCGEEYCQRVEWYLDEYEIEYRKPLDGLRIGERVARLKKLVREEQNTTLDTYA